MYSIETMMILMPIIIIFIIILIINILPYISKENFNNEKKETIKDFDNSVIELGKLKNDKPKIKDYKPTKTSELKLFCNQNIDKSLSCYDQ